VLAVESARTKLVVGLGNPGKEYAETRHNIGFMALDRLAGQYDCSFKRKLKFAAEVGELGTGEGKVVLAKPQTYMNRSGLTVGAIAGWLKISPPEMLVVVDDADLPLGQLRLRLSGGSGGHNGLRSIIEALGGREDFPRLRIGIGRTGPSGADITGHVLGKFAAAERSAVAEALQQAAAAIECCWREGLTFAMNRFNRKTPKTSGEQQEGD
jgi:peptidyl-tRNA hydrolase, PTH1 family